MPLIGFSNVFGGCRALLLTAAILAKTSGSVDACSDYYGGKVISVDTGEPIEGAVVVIEWIKKPILAMDGAMSIHKFEEGLTAKDGSFSLSSCRGIDWNPLTFVHKFPLVAIFSPGYAPWPIRGDPSLAVNLEEGLLKNTTVKLAKLKTTDDIKRFSTPTSIGLFMYPPAAKAPLLLRLLNEQRRFAGLPPYSEQ